MIKLTELIIIRKAVGNHENYENNKNAVICFSGNVYYADDGVCRRGNSAASIPAADLLGVRMRRTDAGSTDIFTCSPMHPDRYFCYCLSEGRKQK